MRKHCREYFGASNNDCQRCDVVEDDKENESKQIYSGLKGDIQLSEKERRRIIRKSLQKYSWKTKCTVAMEEFAELQQQVSKQVRGYGDRIGLLEEMADAYICLNFLESIFDIKPEDLQKAIDVKLERERRNL